MACTNFHNSRWGHSETIRIYETVVVGLTMSINKEQFNPVMMMSCTHGIPLIKIWLGYIETTSIVRTSEIPLKQNIFDRRENHNFDNMSSAMTMTLIAAHSQFYYSTQYKKRKYLIRNETHQLKHMGSNVASIENLENLYVAVTWTCGSSLFNQSEIIRNFRHPLSHTNQANNWKSFNQHFQVNSFHSLALSLSFFSSDCSIFGHWCYSHPVCLISVSSICGRYEKVKDKEKEEYPKKN